MIDAPDPTDLLPEASPELEFLECLELPPNMFVLLDAGGPTLLMQRALGQALVRLDGDRPFLAPFGASGNLLLEHEVDADITVVDGDDFAPDGLTWGEHYAEGLVRRFGVVEISAAANEPLLVPSRGLTPVPDAP